MVIPKEKAELVQFDYSSLPADEAEEIELINLELKEKEDQMTDLVNQTLVTAWEMGQGFSLIRDRLRHNKAGGFRHWLEAEGWAKNKAYRCIQVFENFQLSQIGTVATTPSALYLLAAPSTPEEARDEALELAAAGEPLTHAKAQEVIRKHKAPPPPAQANGPEPVPGASEPVPAGPEPVPDDPAVKIYDVGTSIRRLELAVRAWLDDPDEPVGIEGQVEMLEAIKARDDTGRFYLEQLGETITGTFLVLDLRQACHNVLDQLKQAMTRDERIADLTCPGCGKPGRMVERGLGTIHCQACGEAWSSVEAVVEAGERGAEEIPERSFGSWASERPAPGVDAGENRVDLTVEPSAELGEFDCPRCGLEKVVKTNGGAWCLSCEAKWATVEKFREAASVRKQVLGCQDYRDQLLGMELQLHERLVDLIGSVSSDHLCHIQDWLESILGLIDESAVELGVEA